MADVQLHGELALIVTGVLAADPVTVVPAVGGVMDAIVLAPAAGAIIPAGRVARIRRVTVTATDATAAVSNALFTIWTTTAAGVVQNRWFIGVGNGAANSLNHTASQDISLPIDATAGPITINVACGMLPAAGAGVGPVRITLSVRVD